MATGFGVEELPRGVGGVHDGLIAAAGRLLAPIPVSPAPPASPDADGTPDVYGGAGVPSPGKVSDHDTQAPPYPGTDGGSPYGAPVGSRGPATPPLIGPGGNGAPHAGPPLVGAGGNGAPIGSVPPPPSGSGGLTTGAGQAGDDYNTNGTQVQGLDERLTQEINDAVAQNQQARDKIKSILSEMKIVQASLAGKSDPLALSEYQKYLDQQLAAVQRVLDDAQVNTKASSRSSLTLPRSTRRPGRQPRRRPRWIRRPKEGRRVSRPAAKRPPMMQQHRVKRRRPPRMVLWPIPVLRRARVGNRRVSSTRSPGWHR